MTRERIHAVSAVDADQLDTPVAFLVFNRPDVTRKVFQAIAAARPKTLLVVADGPRADRPGEVERCEQVRKIATAVDWPCDVRTNFAVANLGCGKRVSSGLDWVFEQVPEAIILEDDCLPIPAFFRFCAELLQRYRHDPRVMHISGTNSQFGQRRGDGDYYFSRVLQIWGWASWRRAWKNYDFEMSTWPAFRDGPELRDLAIDDAEFQFWKRTLDQVATRKVNTWDYQLLLAMWKAAGLSAVPNANLIANIGIGADATHTARAVMPLNPAAEDIRFHTPLLAPSKVEPDVQADRFYMDYVLGMDALRGPVARARRKFWKLRRVLQGRLLKRS